MSKHNPSDLKRRERQVERLAQTEGHIRTRLVEMRSDVDTLMHVLDRLTCQQPRIRANAGSLSGLNLLPFPRSRR